MLQVVCLAFTFEFNRSHFNAFMQDVVNLGSVMERAAVPPVEPDGNEPNSILVFDDPNL